MLKAVQMGCVDRISALLHGGASIDSSLLPYARQHNQEKVVEFLEQSLEALSLYGLLKVRAPRFLLRVLFRASVVGAAKAGDADAVAVIAKEAADVNRVDR